MQQDIMRGKQMVDSLFQGAQDGGTHVAIMSSDEYLSQAQRNFNNLEEGYYISPAFLDKVSDSMNSCSSLTPLVLHPLFYTSHLCPRR